MIVLGEENFRQDSVRRCFDRQTSGRMQIEILDRVIFHGAFGANGIGRVLHGGFDFIFRVGIIDDGDCVGSGQP